MPIDHFTRYAPRGARALPLTYGEVAEINRTERRRAGVAKLILQILTWIAAIGWVLALAIMFGESR
jgi:hypothetical protein